MKSFSSFLKEASYSGNIGFEELYKFYQIASNNDITEMEKIIKNNNFEAFKNLIKKVLGVVLK